MNKNFVIAVLSIVLAITVIYSFPAVQSSKDSSQLALHSSVCIYKNNEPVGECTHNAMMNIGLNWTRDLIGNGSASGQMDVIALGNFTSAETATLTTINNTETNAPIPDCGLEPAEGAYSVVSSSVGNWSISKVFTSTCDDVVVNTTALLNATSSGTMFAGKNFAAPVTLQSNDQLNVTWFIWVL